VTVAAVVLAAGGGSRFAGPAHKLVAPFRGRPVIAWSVGAALEAGLDETVVVTGAVDLTSALRDDGVDLEAVRLVDNPDWAEGQAGSLALGLAIAAERGHDAVVVGLGDQPLIGAETWRLVAGAEPAAPIVAATYGGRRRNPVRLARSVWAELETIGDEGARSLMARRPELVMEIPCPGEPADVDTLEDLSRWS
jgi:molybdenum cofactor cytidylyltransferase